MDNIISHLSQAKVVSKVSPKTQNPYTVLELTWNLPNEKPYKQTVFLNDEQIALIQSSVALPESSAI